jgi:hypothetical protein
MNYLHIRNHLMSFAQVRPGTLLATFLAKCLLVIASAFLVQRRCRALPIRLAQPCISDALWEFSNL